MNQQTECDVRTLLLRIKNAVVADYDKPTPESERAIIDACKDFIPLLPKVPKLVAELDWKLAGLMNVLLATANNVGSNLAAIIHQQAHDCAPAEYNHAVEQLALLMAEPQGQG